MNDKRSCINCGQRIINHSDIEMVKAYFFSPHCTCYGGCNCEYRRSQQDQDQDQDQLENDYDNDNDDNDEVKEKENDEDNYDEKKNKPTYLEILGSKLQISDSKSTAKSVTTKNSLRPFQQKIYDQISKCRDKNGLTLYDLQKKLNRPKNHIWTSLQFLLKNKLIDQKGSQPARYSIACMIKK
jgi:hypothetical protein